MPSGSFHVIPLCSSGTAGGGGVLGDGVSLLSSDIICLMDLAPLLRACSCVLSADSRAIIISGARRAVTTPLIRRHQRVLSASRPGTLRMCSGYMHRDSKMTRAGATYVLASYCSVLLYFTIDPSRQSCIKFNLCQSMCSCVWDENARS
jgi:hypothetical protein